MRRKDSVMFVCVQHEDSNTHDIRLCHGLLKAYDYI